MSLTKCEVIEKNRYELQFSVDKETFDKAINVVYRKMVKNYTGLYRDLAVRKRRSEIDGTVGTTVEMGEKLGLRLPLSQLLVQMVHEIEEGKRSICTENMLQLQEECDKLYPRGPEELLALL